MKTFLHLKKQEKSIIGRSRTLLLALLLIITSSAIGQVTMSLTMNVKNGVTSVLSGDKYTYQLAYSVSSTTGGITGAKIVVDLPDGADVYSVGDYVGTVHAPIANFVPGVFSGDRKLTINFVSPLSSGSTGTLEFSIRTTNLTTPNGTVQTSTAEFTGTTAKWM